jgi:RNA polymerase-associated protein RTF1
MGKDQQMAYRVGQVKSVETYHRIYKVNGTPTNKALRIAHGKAERVFLMDVISNQSFTEV